MAGAGVCEQSQVLAWDCRQAVFNGPFSADRGRVKWPRSEAVLPLPRGGFVVSRQGSATKCWFHSFTARPFLP